MNVHRSCIVISLRREVRCSVATECVDARKFDITLPRTLEILGHNINRLLPFWKMVLGSQIAPFDGTICITRIQVRFRHQKKLI
jgi:hypothetical protein